MNYIKDNKLKNTNNTYNVIIEIPKGTKSKFELTEPNFDNIVEVRKLKLKYPFYYGCFPETLAGDGDALDMILLTKKKRNSLDIVKVQPVGVVKTIDNGEVDDKVFVIDSEEVIKNLNKLELEACKFLKKYKGKKANMVIDKIFYDATEAEKLIKEANNTYIANIKAKKATDGSNLSII